MINILKKINKIFLLSIILTFQVNAAQAPTINEVNIIDFGELLGFSGVCHLDFDTKLTSDAGGQLCPSVNTNYGEPGKYVIVADPTTQFSIRIKSKINDGDGLSFIPEGVYRVFGKSDIAITPNQFQTIDSGDTGVITILVGGTLTSAINQNFNTTYNVDITAGIEFNVLP